MPKKIKLKDYSVKQYEELAGVLNSVFAKIEPLKLCLDSESIFSDNSPKFDLSILPCSEALICKESAYHSAIVFHPAVDNSTVNKIVDIAQFDNLNKKTRNGLLSFMNELKGVSKKYDMQIKNLDPLKDIFDNDKKGYFDHLIGWYYDVRYNHNENNIYSSDIYGGKLRGKGLMTYFYQSLGKVIDYDTLDNLLIEDIVEKRTVNMFNRLRKKIPSNDYLSQVLIKKHVKSPFMKMFNTLGFRNMEILESEGCICKIRAKKSDKLSFAIAEDKES
ncbi:MAG: hypothetical protein PHH54_02885 [Candidatus Nanoarchaeia archaeon]|nr:hypothetical protein [Candidatus Nanoarchaeia archaeon]MDD5740905.1 hypothetical protein [Candidatus Nanoarchaeia archaeon]